MLVVGLLAFAPIHSVYSDIASEDKRLTSEKLIKVALTKSSMRTYYMPFMAGTTGGARVSGDAMVDSGSGFTVFTKKMLVALEELGLVTNNGRQIEGMLSDGSVQAVPIYQLSELWIGDCPIRNVEFVVFEKSPRSILGQSVIEKFSSYSVVREGDRTELVFYCQKD